MDTHICWCTVLHTVTVIQRDSLIYWCTDGQIFADLQSDTHNSCDTEIQKQFLIYRRTHRDVLYRETNTVDYIRKDTHICLYTDGYTSLLVYRKKHILAYVQKDSHIFWYTERHTQMLIYRGTQKFVIIQKETQIWWNTKAHTLLHFTEVRHWCVYTERRTHLSVYRRTHKHVYKIKNALADINCIKIWWFTFGQTLFLYRETHTAVDIQ